MSKTGGRQKGTLNKRSEAFQLALSAAAHDPIQDILNCLPQLEPKDRVHANLTLLSYLYPKVRPMEVEIPEGPEEISPMDQQQAIESWKSMMRGIHEWQCVADCKCTVIQRAIQLTE